jgi:nucleotide-binding universal stress UspA family protein
MISRIVAATDLSARGERAVGRALRLRRRFGAQLTVLHVVEDELPERIAARRAEEARELIDGQLRARGEPPDLEATAVEVGSGTGYAAVIERAHTLGAELTVLGSHRENSWRDLFLGSTIERVLRQGSTPVLTVKQEPSADYQRVLVAVDLSVYSRRALEFACRLVPDGELLALHAYDLPFLGFLSEPPPREAVLLEGEILEQMRALLRGLPIAPGQIRPEVRLGGALPVVETAVGEFGPDLLVVGTHGRTGVAHALLGSVAERLLRRPRCDVLAVRAW